MAPSARSLLCLVASFLALHTGTVSANGRSSEGEVNLIQGEASSGQWAFSTVPRHEMPALEARLRGHHDVGLFVEAKVCPEGTNPCPNAKGDQTTCCPGKCGAQNDLFGTCYVPRSSRKVGLRRLAPGGTCPPEAQNPCYNADGSAMVCCAGSCGATAGNTATCTGQQSPASSSAATDAPLTITASNMRAGTPLCVAEASNPCYSSNGKVVVCCPGACGPSKGNVATCASGTPTPTPTPTWTDPPVTSTPTPTPTPTATPSPTAGTPSSSGTKLPTAPTGFQWVANPALTDEFNGNSLDTNKWQPNHPYWEGRLPSKFDPTNVAVGGGYAQLKSTTKTTNMNQVASPMTDPWVSSACLATTGAFAGYGYYEIRMKASNMNMTSSFWLQSQNYEIDVIETIGSPDDTWRSTKMNINTHFFSNGLASASSIDYYKNYDWTLPPFPTYTSGDFHTFSVWFKDAQNLLFYYDGQLVWHMTPPANFVDKMYIFIDTEVFIAEGLPSISDLNNPNNNIFYVDYVRSFTLEPTS